jgi:hypothetical protein
MFTVSPKLGVAAVLGHHECGAGVCFGAGLGGVRTTSGLGASRRRPALVVGAVVGLGLRKQSA